MKGEAAFIVLVKDMEYLPNTEQMRLTGTSTIRMHLPKSMRVEGYYDSVDLDLDSGTQRKLLDMLMARMRLRFSSQKTVEKIPSREPKLRSRFRGVQHVKGKVWKAVIDKQGVRKTKRCNSEVEAALQYNAWMVEHSLYGKLNDVDE